MVGKYWNYNGKFKIKELTEFSNLDDIKNYQFGKYRLYISIQKSIYQT